MLLCGVTVGIVKVGVTVKFRLNLPDAWFRLSCATGKFDLKSGAGKLRSWYSRDSATGRCGAEGASLRAGRVGLDLTGD